MLTSTLTYDQKPHRLPPPLYPGLRARTITCQFMLSFHHVILASSERSHPMIESPFRLQDKSVLIFGDFNGLSQALVRDFTENGADVGFLNNEKPQTGRFLENINDTREVHASYGRAVQIDVNVTGQKLSLRSRQPHGRCFGRIDVFVDLKMSSLNENTADLTPRSSFSGKFEPFFRNKKRGRVVFIREDESAAPLLPPGFDHPARRGVLSLDSVTFETVADPELWH